MATARAKSKSVTPQANAGTINGIDMHAMVKQLQDDKQGHEQGIENLTLGELREKVSNSLVTD